MKNTAFWMMMLMCLWCVHAVAGVVTVDVAADSFIIDSSAFANNNAGVHTHVAAGTDGMSGIRRGLLFFDLSNIAPSTSIESAELKIDVVRVPLFGAVDSTFALHLLTADWEEGGKIGNDGQLAGTGEVTWATPWASAGGDFVALASSTTPVSSLRTYAFTGLKDDVQFMVSNPDQNFGWILMSQSEANQKTARQFGSMEGGKPAALIFIPEPASILVMAVGLLGFGRRTRC